MSLDSKNNVVLWVYFLCRNPKSCTIPATWGSEYKYDSCTVSLWTKQGAILSGSDMGFLVDSIAVGECFRKFVDLID